jgi:hypothetical protein
LTWSDKIVALNAPEKVTFRFNGFKTQVLQRASG